tara:strand:- start:4805 stop:4933 length:129 start_codon:yes stop_codon:yes gene_type:complete
MFGLAHKSKKEHKKGGEFGKTRKSSRAIDIFFFFFFFFFGEF